MAAPAVLPAGERVYAIGDIHGCLTELEHLHQAIAKDLAAHPVRRATLVHLGDYIDRGPSSAAVLTRLMAPPAHLAGMQIINLMGNHEAMLLDALDGDEEVAEAWLANGGDLALESWGATGKDWRLAIPAEQIEFIRQLPLMHVKGGYVFVHAGLNPDLPLAEQSQDDLLWIREPFLYFSGQLSHVVVHGHTPEAESPIVCQHRIGIDTGAVFGGPLTCVVLNGGKMRFLAV
jgi:serine/threonine protein phosphatase 1